MQAVDLLYTVRPVYKQRIQATPADQSLCSCGHTQLAAPLLTWRQLVQESDLLSRHTRPGATSATRLPSPSPWSAGRPAGIHPCSWTVLAAAADRTGHVHEGDRWVGSMCCSQLVVVGG
jgi:hypothetical protein